MSTQTYPFKKLHFKASWVKQFYSDTGDEYLEQQTFDILTRMPALLREPDFYTLLKVTKSTSLHIHLTRQGWTLAAIDEASLRVVHVN